MRFFASIFIALAALLAASKSVSCDIPDHLITSLPGYPNGGQTPSKQYSGMIAVDQAETRFLHYHLVLSENDPAADPLVLWNNGGPGCSSYDAFLFEQGPVRFTQHLDPSSGLPALTDNPNRWNLIASVIYLESPVDVGYSYTTNSSWISNDNTTAIDNFNFLQKFYQGYPEFRHNPLYLAGESYSGMYTPMTADLIRISNAEGKTSIPLKGIMVGNGCIGYNVGSCGSTNQANRFSMDAYFRHMLIPTSMHDEITSECTDWDHPSSRCSALIADAYRVGGTFNIYSVYDGKTEFNDHINTINHLLTEFCFRLIVQIAQTVMPCPIVRVQSGPRA
jgi:carboxypeptidase C (cathepsin A)